MGSAVTLDSFNHIGHVVRDRDATMKSWSSLLGIEWRRTAESGALNLAWGSMGGTEVELLQPTDDKSLWAVFLKEHGEGLHHVCCRVADVDAAVANLEAEGGEKMMGIPGTMAYVDIKGPGGVILELLKTP